MCNCKHLIIKTDKQGKTLYKCDIDISRNDFYFLEIREKFNEIHKFENKNFVRSEDCAFKLNDDTLSECPFFENQ